MLAPPCLKLPAVARTTPRSSVRSAVLLHATKKTFGTFDDLLASSNGKPVLVDFYATCAKRRKRWRRCGGRHILTQLLGFNSSFARVRPVSNAVSYPRGSCFFAGWQAHSCKRRERVTKFSLFLFRLNYATVDTDKYGSIASRFNIAGLPTLSALCCARESVARVPSPG